jgi:hypothetical protein
MGDFLGFELHRCEGIVRIDSCDPGVERVALTACERKLVLTQNSPCAVYHARTRDSTVALRATAS